MTITKVLQGHTSPETAYVVSDYPYGRYRTEKRFWLETTKNGDRLCGQTLNPKTFQWNKPKKSTYCDVGFLYLDENDHVHWDGISLGWVKEDRVDEFLTNAGGTSYKWSELQIHRIKQAIGIARTQKYVKHTIINTTNWTPEQRAAHEEEQKKINHTLLRIASAEYKQVVIN